MWARYRNFIATLICATTVCTPVHAQNCNSEIYRLYHPDECTKSETSSIKTGTIIAGSALALVGGGIALLGNSSSGSSSNSNTPRVLQPTTSTYDHVGADVDIASINRIIQDSEYSKNIDQYNEIRLAYSLARGYTGLGTTIAVFDSGKNTWHGGNVAHFASGQIAPNATVNSYMVSDRNGNFMPFNEIATVIESANNANVYNFSWAMDKPATQIKSRSQLEHLTSASFINSLTNAATQKDAIFVWAAGNEYRTQPNALAAMPNVIPELQGHVVNVVAWDNATGALADFSNSCGVTMNYCITAPGTNLTSPQTSEPVHGTSFAAPIVSSAIAVIREAFPYMKSTEITHLLFTTARDLGVAGIDETYGHGMLDLERATRPVGTTLVPLSDGMTVNLTQARVGSSIGNQIKSKDIKFAFVDSYGRAFETSLNDNIKIKNRSIGFERLREHNTPQATIGKFTFGTKQSDLLMADGFLQSDTRNTMTFIRYDDKIELGNTELFQHTTFGTMNPRPTPESMISGFFNVYTASIFMGTSYKDFSFSIGIPDTIIGGNAHLNIPTGRTSSGEYTFRGTTIDLTNHTPTLEYNATYKFVTAGFVDNPYGTDEFYILGRGKLEF